MSIVRNSVTTEVIAQTEAELVWLDGERVRVQQRLAALRAGTATRSSPIPNAAHAITAERIALFRSFFRGREDVYATRWVSAKTGKSGYGPACTREYLQRLWREPELRTQPRPPEVLLPLTDAAIREHLEGRVVLGVYPMCMDETCGFLAVDFDGKAPAKRRRLQLPGDLRMLRLRLPSSSATLRVVGDSNDWWSDVRAFAATCATFGVPIAIERSRSGNGAHVCGCFSQSEFPP